MSVSDRKGTRWHCASNDGEGEDAKNAEYALEQVFAVIDARYRSRKPLIVTTNLTLDALKHPDDLAHARIYDRILEICAPILFGGANLRVEKANEMKTAARNILLSGDAA